MEEEEDVKRVAIRPVIGLNICAACANSCISLTQSSVLAPGARSGSAVELLGCRAARNSRKSR